MENNHYKKRFRSRLLAVILFGFFAYAIDGWGTDNDELYRLMLRIILYGLFILGTLSEIARGHLKNSPFYKASFSEAIETKIVRYFMAFYFLATFGVILKAISQGANLYRFIDHPFHQYLFFAPLFIVVYLGMYMIEKEHCEE